MGHLIRAFDWSSTKLGPPTNWPQSLRTAVRLMLTTNHPVFLFWGEDHLCFYNDAYSRSIGPERHPSALGRPGREVWAEIWNIIGPQIEQVMAAGGATWHENHLVPITRHGRREEVYWTYSYGPIDDEAAANGVGGVLVLCTETTQQVLLARERAQEVQRLDRMFAQAPGAVAILRGPSHVFEIVNPAYARLVGQRPVLGRTVAEALPEVVEQGFIDLLDKVFRTGEPHVGRQVPVALQQTLDAPLEQLLLDFVYQPLTDGAGQVTGIFVQATDETERARAEAELRAREARQTFVIGLEDRLREVAEPRVIMALAAEALGRELGAGRCGYGEIDPDGAHAVVDQDWTDGTMPSAVGRYSLDDFAPDIVGTYRAGRVVRQDDTYGDRRVGADWRRAYDALLGARACLGVPLIKDGRWVAVLFVDSHLPRPWTDAEQALVREVAERTWAAVERARAETSLRAREMQYRSLFEAIEASFCVIEVKFGEHGTAIDYRFVEVNNAFERQTGLKDAAGRWMLALAPDHEQHWFDIYGRVALTGKPARFEIEAAALGRWFDVHAYRVGEPEARRVAVLSNDISERKRAEAALKESESRFRQLAETIDEVFYVTDLDAGRLLYLSPAFEAVWGRPFTELLSDLSRFINTIHPDDRHRVIAAQSAQSRGEPVDIVYRILRPEGAQRWVRDRAFPVQADGVRRSVGLAEDITERLEAELQLAERNELLRVAQEAGGVGAFEWYPETGKLVVSDQYRRIWGFAPDEQVTADRLMSLIHPDDHGMSGPGRLATHDNPLEYAEYRMRRPDTGEERWIARKGEIMQLGDGPRRFIGVAYDITEQKRAAARFQGVFSSDLMGLTVFDCMSGATVMINDRFLAMTGHTRADFDEGRWDWRDFTVEGYLHLDEAAIAQARRQGRWAAFEKEYRRKDGTRFPVRLSSAPLPGEPGRLVVAIEDISERRAAEAALRASEERFRSLADAMPQLVWTATAEGRVDYYNARRQAYAGAASASGTWDWAPLGPSGTWDWAPLVHPDDLGRTHTTWARSATTGEPYSCEHRLARIDGSWSWHVSRALADMDASGAIVKWYGTATDVDELKAAQEALRGLNANLESQVEARTRDRDRVWRNSRDLLVVVDTEGVFRAVSPAWSVILGHAQEEVVGRSFEEFIWPDDAERMRGGLAAAAAGTDLTNFETRHRHENGTPRWISWHTSLEDGLTYAYGRDVTEERLRIEEIASANRQLNAQIEERERVEATLRQMQRLEAVGQLTSGVAHDFNNLLTVITGNIGFLERGLAQQDVDGKLLKRLGYMQTAAERGAKLTAQLLAFSRRQRLAAKPVDLNETVAGMRDLLQSSMGGSVRVETVPRPGLWPALVDATQIELVILNLAINARDAIEVGGSLSVETANVTLGRPATPEEPAAGDYVMVSVSDTGVGMTDEVRAKAFEPFFTTKPVGQGSGLGLAQVYGFAKQSGGGVWIETKVGEGTTVKVYLPRAAEPAVTPAPLDEAPFEGVIGGRTRRVLLVDDDSAVREVTAAMLEELGCIVVEAGSGNAALDLLDRELETFDLLMVDYAMPGMNGADVAREAAIRRPTLPILFVTGYADLTALKEVGAELVVQKPFRAGELASKVRSLLGPPPNSSNVVALRR